MTRPRRRDLLQRHCWRTGLDIAPAVAEDAALVICGFFAALPREAAALLDETGLIHPQGPSRVGVKVAPRRNAAKVRAHRKAQRAR